MAEHSHADILLAIYFWTNLWRSYPILVYRCFGRLYSVYPNDKPYLRTKSNAESHYSRKYHQSGNQSFDLYSWHHYQLPLRLFTLWILDFHVCAWRLICTLQTRQQKQVALIYAVTNTPHRTDDMPHSPMTLGRCATLIQVSSAFFSICPKLK